MIEIVIERKGLSPAYFDAASRECISRSDHWYAIQQDDKQVIFPINEIVKITEIEKED
jgi:hypothetical protein